MAVSWEITPQKVQTAIQKIIETSNPAKLILFGSYISGKTHINSDLDVLVVTKNEIESPRKESVNPPRPQRNRDVYGYPCCAGRPD